LKKKSGIIKILISILKAVGFLALYLGAQLFISMVFYFVYSVYFILRYYPGNYKITDEISQKIYSNLSNYTSLILILSAIFTFAILFLIHTLCKKKFYKEINLHKIPMNQIITAFIFGVILNKFSVAMMSLLPIPQAWYDANEKSVGSVTAGNFMIALISTVIIAPIIEEVIFRGGVYFTLRKTIGPILAAIISAAAFGIFHGNILQMLYTAFCAIFIIYVFEKTNSLTGSIMVHSGFNFSAIFFAIISSYIELTEFTWLIITGILCLFCLIYISTFTSRRSKKDRPF